MRSKHFETSSFKLCFCKHLFYNLARFTVLSRSITIFLFNSSNFIFTHPWKPLSHRFLMLHTHRLHWIFNPWHSLYISISLADLQQRNPGTRRFSRSTWSSHTISQFAFKKTRLECSYVHSWRTITLSILSKSHTGCQKGELHCKHCSNTMIFNKANVSFRQLVYALTQRSSPFSQVFVNHCNISFIFQ